MDRTERVRATHLHACLRYVNREYLTNTSVRQRFGIETRNSAKASRLIAEAVKAGAIVPDDPVAAPKPNVLCAGVGEGRRPRRYLIRCHRANVLMICQGQ